MFALIVWLKSFSLVNYIALRHHIVLDIPEVEPDLHLLPQLSELLAEADGEMVNLQNEIFDRNGSTIVKGITIIAEAHAAEHPAKIASIATSPDAEEKTNLIASPDMPSEAIIIRSTDQYAVKTPKSASEFYAAEKVDFDTLTDTSGDPTDTKSKAQNSIKTATTISELNAVVKSISITPPNKTGEPKVSKSTDQQTVKIASIAPVLEGIEVKKISSDSLASKPSDFVIEPRKLKHSCRYQSEISTQPPPKQVALTFDDGPTPRQTELILDVLKKYNITATFFMLGRMEAYHPEIVAQVRDAHQIIGYHSWDHPNFHDLSVAKQEAQLLRDETPPENDLQPRLFRYPYGNSSCDSDEFLHSHGYEIVGWHIDSCDWAFEKNGSVGIREANLCGVLPQNRSDYVSHVVSSVKARDGGIILMHDTHPNTIKKLEEIVTQLLAEGFVFGTVLDEGFKLSMR